MTRAAAACLIALAVWSQPARAAAVPADGAEQTAAAGGPSDAWTFEDEDAAPGWGEALRAQAPDLAGVAAFTALALAGFFRKSVRLKWITLVVAVVYLGFLKSQLLSIVNLFALVEWNLPIVRYSLAWYLLASAALVSTILWGRLYCGRICAFGALTQLMDKVVPAGWRRELPARFDRRAAGVKYVVLAGALLYFAATRDRSIYRYIEPFWMFGLHGTTATWIGVGALLAVTIFVRNLYCRYLCPVGAALGLLSKLTIFRIPRWSECRTCRICEKACEWNAIRGPEILVSECVRCDDCERLYLDRTRCPHWIVLLKRQGTTLVPAGRA